MNDFERIKRFLEKLGIVFYIYTIQRKNKIVIVLPNTKFSFLFDLIDGEITEIVER